MKTLCTAALIAATALASPAAAEVLTYDFGGVFENGQDFSGSLTFDDQSTEFFSQTANICLVGYACTTNIVGVFTESDFGEVAVSGFIFRAPEYSVQLAFLSFFDEQAILRRILLSELDDSTFLNVGQQNGIPLRSGTITLALPAVPEPATWAMMIGGFGLVGAAMRRRPSASVTFA